MTGWIEATISVLRCEAEGHTTSHLTLIGDTDMVTNGIAALSSVAADEIVVAEQDASELGDPSGRIFEARINSLLHRDDLRYVQLRRLDEAPIPAGLSFRDFRKAHAPPRAIYGCPRCGSDAIAVRMNSPAEYRHRGGTLTVTADFELRG